MRRSSYGTLAVPVLILLACGDGGGSTGDPTDPGPGDDPNAVAEITLTGTLDSLAVGDSVQLTATALNASGDTVAVTFGWTSSNTQVATVSGTGLVVGRGVGAAVVRAEAQGKAVSWQAVVTAFFTAWGIAVGAGGKDPLDDLSVYEFLAYYLVYVMDPPGLSDGSRGEAREEGGAQPAAVTSTPNLNATEAFFAGGNGTNGAIAGDQAYHFDFPTETSTKLTLSVPRNTHTLTALADGRFLVAGGTGSNLEYWSSAEVFDPESMQITPTGSMAVARSGHAAARLNDGRVLITGGGDGGPTLGHASTELFDPATGGFSPGPDMSTPRRFHSATRLLDGRVLVLGGQTTPSAEIYDPGTNSFSSLPSPVGTHGKWHTATLLQDGKVLIAGGDGDPAGFSEPTAAAELFDPVAMTFTAVGDMNTVRMRHFAVLIADGRVLLGGGIDESEFPTAEAEVFDPAAGTFMALEDMPRVGSGQAAVYLTR